jgi:hypothetical protein
MPLTKSPAAKTDRNAEIVRRVVEGKGQVSLTDIGKEYSLTRSRIQRIVGEAGVSIRAMKRAQRKPIKSICGICGKAYLKGSYVAHCEAAGHRRLTPPGEKTDRNQLIVQYYDVDKYNTTEIAEHFGIPQPIVTRILHRNGIRAEGRRKRKGGLPPALVMA